MKLRRRRHGTTSSDGLDLLLDTVCNTFGGVVFIAILMVMMLESTTARPVEQSESPEVAQQLALELQAARHERDELQASLATQQELIDEFSTATLRDRIAQRDQLRQQRDAQQAEVTRQQQSNQRQEDDLTRRQEDQAELARQLARARNRARELEEQIEREQQSRQQSVDTPVSRIAGGRPEVGLILRYGRMYVWHRWAPDGRRLGLNTDDFVVVGREGDEVVTAPRPGGGIKLNDQPQTAAAIRQRLRGFAPQEFVMTLIVRPDSYRECRCLRSVLKAMGFRIRLILMDSNSPVKDRGGSDSRVQ